MATAPENRRVVAVPGEPKHARVYDNKPSRISPFKLGERIDGVTRHRSELKVFLGRVFQADTVKKNY